MANRFVGLRPFAYATIKRIKPCGHLSLEPKLLGTVSYKRPAAAIKDQEELKLKEEGFAEVELKHSFHATWCFSSLELEAAHREAMLLAIQDLRELKDSEPLRYQMERCNPYFMDYPDARSAIGLALQGKGFKGRAKPKKMADIERNEKICLAVFLLHQSGLPIKSGLDKGSACELVAARVHKSLERVFAIWSASGEPKDRNLAPWEYLDIAPPNHEEIIDYCLNGKFRESQTNELLRATMQYFVDQNIKGEQ